MLALAILTIMAVSTPLAAAAEAPAVDAKFRDVAQWTTSSRLLHLGESIAFRFYVPEGVDVTTLDVFPNYLETASFPDASVFPSDLSWLDDSKAQPVALRFTNGEATATYLPQKSGNYLARWRVNGEVLYRYFSVIEDRFAVIVLASHMETQPQPTLHATGIPFEYRLPVEPFDPALSFYKQYSQFDEADPVFQQFREYHRLFGDSVIPCMPDTPDLSHEQRVVEYGRLLDKVRSLLPDPNEARSARVDVFSKADPGYARALVDLGVNHHSGLCEANWAPWLGMPEFGYFSSREDARKPNQGAGGSLFAHQWDFCAGWHFIGPVDWHYAAAEGNWREAEVCIRQGMVEVVNAAAMSGHPVACFPLYDGVVAYRGYPNHLFKKGFADAPMKGFVEHYLKLIAFEFPREFPCVYARSIDVADYYRRHFKTTPRTVYVSRSDHVPYDSWWQCNAANQSMVMTRERLAINTRTSSVLAYQRIFTGKDPMSSETMLVEDQQRSIRFERAAAAPIWWFDYTSPTLTDEGSIVQRTETPNIEVIREDSTEANGMARIKVHVFTEAEFENFAIALWDVAKAFGENPERIRTNAREVVAARNVSGECHLAVFFDLKPDVEIVLEAPPSAK